ncbi:CoA transferase [Arthrobacter sp. AZCC_0090]|uniref:CaiB/BaiF CoA-transferase family protein n=1 Tax=Arthrobacter sp. AZCC_0090 TaxID=2735881 RepID=UPI0016132573|nr:CoA transferase [Arthrobacter sp. AZCC_0090]MBB6407150.1 crotonobetainyl-CoA:carnitine CoA-transferase CaiB-like acyl-CoA transferase [Arthrobacter sp. AZCC_0090]
MPSETHSRAGSSEPAAKGFLSGVRVIELADELGEFCGRVLAGLGAEVIKVEPPEGEATRSYGPFYGDQPDPERSLYFWHYNLGKKSISIDLDSQEGREEFKLLCDSADIVIDTRHRSYLNDRGIGGDVLRQRNRGLIYARISPFGDDGPWADYVSSDLVHLALGGVMMNCGYDRTPLGDYDTQPIAPQLWHSYHITGDLTVIQLLAALNYRLETGEGQSMATAVHDAVSKNTETDVPSWIYARQEHARQTSRHSLAAPVGKNGLPATTVNPNARSKDGRWVLAYRTYLEGFGGSAEQMLAVLREFGSEEDIADAKYAEPGALSEPTNAQHLQDVINRMVGAYKYDRDIWKAGQAQGMTWAPVRRPEENLADEHWKIRSTFSEVAYPELGKTFTQVTGRWCASNTQWQAGPRAPLHNEHGTSLRASLPRKLGTPSAHPAGPPRRTGALSAHGKPFALDGIRVVDLAWMLASAGAGRFFAAHGAEVIKVEHSSRIDGMRLGSGIVPPGGKAERDAATGPIFAQRGESLNRSGAFGEINAGKLGLGLNLKSEEGKRILTDLIREADVIIEGFSPGTMERMGFGYERLKEINPRIVYVQQSGFGQKGTFGNLRSFGPTAQAFSGLTEMSGLPEPYAPAGIGYSYLDWVGAYQMAMAMMAGVYRQRLTGEGCWIDSSQTEAGIYHSGTATLDFVVNGRPWARIGNRSPYKAAAPSGAFRTAGIDRWIAISVFDNPQWAQLVGELGRQDLLSDSRFVTLESRLAHQEELEAEIQAATAGRDGFELMAALQARSVPAGVCQTAADRVESDPQLKHLEWLVDLNQSEIGTWPVRELAGRLSGTPSYIGGKFDRHAPSYGEDTWFVLKEILSLTNDEIELLARDGVIEGSREQVEARNLS